MLPSVAGGCKVRSVIGTFVIIAVLLLFPIGFLMSTGVAAAVIGWALKSNADAEHADSELLETNY